MYPIIIAENLCRLITLHGHQAVVITTGWSLTIRATRAGHPTETLPVCRQRIFEWLGL